MGIVSNNFLRELCHNIWRKANAVSSCVPCETLGAHTRVQATNPILI